MHTLPSISTLGALLALVVVTKCVLVSANPITWPQPNVAERNDVSPVVLAGGYNNQQSGEAAIEAANDEPKTLANYARCYYFTNANGEHLGSDGGVYSYLKFGSNNHRRPFRLCKERDECSKGGQLLHNGKFWLQDYQGSTYAKGRNTIAGNEYGYLYPSYNGWTNYLHFKAHRDCDLGENEKDCYVRLKLVDEKNGYDGLEVNSAQYPFLSLNKQHTISVQFNQVDCPDDDDDQYEL